jgi:hypothetical protein
MVSGIGRDRAARGCRRRALSGDCDTRKTKPPLALVKLLKVLDYHPDLLNEVKIA